MARSDPRLAVEVTLSIGFTALLAAVVIVAARGVLTAGDALGPMIAVMAVVCWVGHPLATAPVAIIACMFFLTFAERPVDELRLHGSADWWRLAGLAGTAAGAAAARARWLRRYRVPWRRTLPLLRARYGPADADGVTTRQGMGKAAGISGRGGAGRPPTPVPRSCRRQPR